MQSIFMIIFLWDYITNFMGLLLYDQLVEFALNMEKKIMHVGEHY